MKNVIRNFVLSLTVISAAVACVKRNNTSESDNSGSVSLMRQPLKGADKVKRCSGTEPFWSLNVTDKGLEFKDEGTDLKVTAIAKLGNTLGSMTSYIAFRHDVYGADTDKSHKISAIIKQEQCSDGMSDIVHPYSAIVIIGGETLYHGCCAE